MKQIKLLKGTRSHIPDALKLVNELAVFERSPGEVEVTVAEMTNWGFGKNKVFDFYVLKKNNKIVGLAVYYFKYSTWKGRCMFLEDIIVTSRERGNGYGKLLFEKVLQIAKKENVRRLEWQVLEWNEPAIGFYKKYGSELDGEWINCKLRYKQLQLI